jgi:hypothetical protein
MADNVLKATVDAIADSDNELAGQLVTRVRSKLIAGRNDGQLATATPTRLISPEDVFLSSMVGEGVDIIVPAIGAAHGFEGSYLIDTFVDSKNVTLTKIDGLAPAFTDTDPVRWRFTTLKAETTLEFPVDDRIMRLWIGDEPLAIPYAELDQTPGAQEFRGLGPQRYLIGATIAAAAPTDIVFDRDALSTADIGKAIWVLPIDPVNGNEGPQLITGYVPATRTATVSPGGLTADQSDVRIMIKDYLTPDGYPSVLSRELSAVIDGSQSFSQMDQVRRAMLTDYAEGTELDRIGRNLAVKRLRGMGDETYRCLLQTLAYLPKATVYGLELVLDCLLPGGGWSIYEDLINFPGKVFILLPALSGDSSDFEGKAFLAPSGKDVTPPIDPSKAGGAALGRGDRERQTSSNTTTVTIARAPITVLDVLREDVVQALEMDVLPSADTPAWTFVTQGGGGPAEGAVFSIVATGPSHNVLAHTQPGAPTVDGGYYKKTIAPDYLVGSIIDIEAWFRVDSFTTVAGFPWGFYISDLAINKQYGMWFNQTQVELSASPGLGTVGPVAHGIPVDDGAWRRLKLRRESIGDQHLITAWIGDKIVFAEIDSTVFPATAANEIAFGYFLQAAQNWTVHWDRVQVLERSTRNYWDIADNNGATAGGDNNFVAFGGTPFVVGDVGKNFRVRTRGTTGGIAARRNVGLWRASAFVSSSTLTLAGIQLAKIVTVQTIAGDNFVDLLDPLFIPEDDVKQIEIFDSVLGNNGTRNALEYVNPRRLRVDGAPFVSEAQLSYRFNPNLLAASSAMVWELIDVGTNVGAVLTLREVLPLANTDVEVWYTSVLSAQILRNEFVRNDGSAGAIPNIYYPFYVFDVDRATRQLLDEITAAGIIPAYEREF